MTANYKVNYFFANAQAGRRTLDLQLSTQLQSALLGVVGQQATVTGTGQVEAVYAGLGVSVDFSQSGAGADKLYLDGQLSEYSISVAGNVLTLTRTGAVNTSGSPDTTTNEQVTSTYKLAVNADDTIVFANGAITVANAVAKVAEGVTANDLNPAETSLVLPTFEAHGASASRVLLTQPGSVVAAATDPLLVIAGTSGVDKVYVRAGAQVDARALGGATDLIYLTGKWSDYTKTIDAASKSITFTRTVGGQTEKVWVAAGSGMLNDLLIFADGAVKSQSALNGLTTSLSASLVTVGGTLGNGQTTPIETLAVATLTSLSQDSGNATDWITNQTGQTIGGSYSGHLRAGDKIQVRLDGGDWQDATVTTTSVQGGTFELAGVTLTGTHTVQVRTLGLESNWGGYADARNTVTGQSKTATLDQGVPEGQLAAHGDTALAQDLWVNNVESQVALKISTEKLKVGDTIQLKKDGQDFGAPHTVTDAEILAGQVVLPINKADLVGSDATDKAYTLTAVFSDTAGNTSTSDPYTLTVDTGVPTVVAASVATTLDDGTTAQPDPLLTDALLNASETSVLLKVSSDTATGKTFKTGDVLQVIDNGAVVATYTVKPEDAGKTDFYISVNKANLAKGSNGQPTEGDHVLTIKAVDDAGNTSSVQTTVTVDTQLPSPLLEIAATNTTTAAAQDNVLGRTEDTITLTVKADAQGTAFKAGDVVELVHLSAVGVTPATSEALVQKSVNGTPTYKVTIQNDGDFATFEVQKSDLGAAEVRLGAHVNDTAGNTADSNALIVRTEFYITNDAMVAGDVTALDVTSDIVLVASETLADNAAVAGKYITFTNKNNTHAFSGEAETHTFQVLVTDTRFVTISGDKKYITIKPPVDFDFGNGYNITIDAGAFQSAAGVANVATASTDGLNFDTVQVGADFADAKQGQTLDATGAVQDGKEWFTIDNQGSFFGNSVDLDLAGGNYAMVVKDTSANGGSPLVNNDGIGVQGNAVNVSNWGTDDLIYVDDQKITVANPTAINDAARVSIMGGQDVTKQDGSAATSVQTVRFDAGSGNSEPGYIHILSTEGNAPLADADLRAQLNVSNTRLGTSVAITRTDVSGDALAYISSNTDLSIEVTPSNGSTLREGDSVVLQFYDDSGVLKTSAAAHVVTADEAGNGKATITLNGLTGLTEGTTYTLVAKYTDKDSAVTITEPVRDGGLTYKGAPKQPALAFASGQDGTIDSAEDHVDVVVSGFDYGDSIALQLDGQTIGTASVVSAPQGANTIANGVLTIGEAEFNQGSVTLRVLKTALGDADPHNLTVHASNVVNLTSDSTALTVQAPEYVALSGVAGFGPVLAGNDLTVTAYDQSGQVLATDTTVEDTGAFTLQILKTHTGPVLITVTSRGPNPDYRDENTQANTNLGNADNSTPYTVRAVVNADGTPRTVNITPLTDLAAQKLLASNAQLQPGTSTDAVTAVNTGVAQKFLGQNSDVTTLGFTPTVTVDGTDNTAAADLYGQVLKQLSDLSAAKGGNLGAAQAELAAKIVWTPGQLASDLTLAPQAASTALLAKVAFNADNTAAAAQAAPLAAQDLVDLGLSAMSGLTSARQQAVLDAIKADTSANMADVAALKILVDRVAALGKIQDYADGTSAAAPQLSDYVAAAKPGSTTVTAENLAAVNVRVLASDAAGTDSAAKVQALVATGVTAHTAALSKIEAYAANGTTAPTVDDYRDAGIQGVNADNLSAVNHRVEQVAAADADTVADIQTLATAGANAQVQAFRTLRNYALDAEANDPPTVEHLRDIGVTGSVTPEALNNAKALLQLVADASVNTSATMAERLQTQFDAVQKLNGWAQNSTDPTKAPSVQDYLDAGITGVSDAKLASVNAQLAAQNSLSDIATVEPFILTTQTVQITNVVDDAGAVKGSVAAEGITNDLSPHLEGTLNSALDAGQQIIVLRDGVQVGTATVDGTSWTFDDLISPAPSAADGQRYSYTARVSDAKGNTGPLSDAYAITVDAQAPVLSTDLSSYFVTDISAQQNKGALLEGQAAPANGKVTITFTNHDPIVVDANALGAWSVILPADISANTQFTLQFTDAAGESSEVSAPQSLQVSNTAAPPILGTLAAPVLKSGQDTGLDNTDGITRLSTPTIVGRGAQANATIHIAVQGSEVGTATANSLGDWSYTFTGAQLTANSLQAITVKQSASGATTSPTSQALELRVDTAMPDAPTLDTITVINGQVSDDRIPGAQTGQKVSKDTLSTLSGSAQASAQIEVFVDGRSVGTTLANSEGQWTFTPAQALATGVRQIHVKQTSLAGNTSPDSALSYLRLDTTVAKPTFTMSNDSGSLISGSTIDTTPTFRGSNAEAFATIEVFVGGQSIGTTTASAAGAWSFTPEAPLATGSHTIVVSQTDLAGNTSDTTTPAVLVQSLSTSFTGVALVQIAAPVVLAVPSAPTLAQASNTGSTADTLTSVLKPTLTGTVANPSAGMTVSIFDQASITVTGTTSANGVYQKLSASQQAGLVFSDAFTPAGGSTVLDTGKAVYKATVGGVDWYIWAREGSGYHLSQLANTSEWYFEGSLDGAFASSPTGITAWAKTSITATEVQNGGLVTPVPAIALSDTLLGSASVNATTGAWTFTPTNNLSASEHPLVVQVRDSQGNTSERSSALPLVIDTAPPMAIAAPVLSDTSNSGSKGDTITSDALPTLSGTGAAHGATVQILRNGAVIGTTTASNTGAWTFTPTTQLAEGTANITARQLSATGVASADSPALSLTIDTAPAASPGLTALAGSQSPRPIYSGTAEAGASVELTFVSPSNVTTTQTVTASANGSWTYQPTDPQEAGNWQVSARQQDAAGNASAPSAPQTVTIDAAVAVPAAAPALVLATDSNTGSQADTITSVTTPTFNISGIDSTATAVQVSVDGGNYTDVSGFTTGNTTLSFTPASPLSASAAGTAHTIAVRQVVSGVNSAVSSASITVDNAAIWSEVSSTATVSTATAARYVRIYHNPSSSVTSLGLTELKVFTADGTNVAAGRPASVGAASGNTPWQGVNNPMALTDNVVGGDGNGVYGNGSNLTHLDSGDAGGYIDLDLGNVYDVSKLVFWGINSDPAASNNLRVFLSATAFSPTATAAQLMTQQSVSNFDVGSTDRTLNGTGTSVSASAMNKQVQIYLRTTAPELTGVSEAGATIEISENDVVLTTVTAGSNGTWTATLPATTAGSHTYSIKTTDLAGLSVTKTGAFYAVPDLTGVQPSAPVLAVNSDSGTQGDGTTNVTLPTLTGTGSLANTQVELVNASGAVLGRGMSNSLGAWTITLTQPLTEGLNQVKARYSHALGTGPASDNALALTLDTVPDSFALGASLALKAGNDTGTSSVDGITQVTQPWFKGTGAKAGASVQVQFTATGQSTLTATAVAADDGSFEVQAPSTLANATWTASASFVDAANNRTTPLVATFTVDNVPPGNPSITTSGTVGQSPTIAGGGATAGETIKLFDNSTHELLGQTVADSLGNWSTQLLGLTTGGQYTLRAERQDTAGNIASATQTITLAPAQAAAVAPGAVTQLVLDTANANSAYTSASTVLTRLTQPVIKGLADPGVTVNIYNGTTLVGTGSADGSGAFAIRLSSPVATDGLKTLQVQAASAGLTGPMSSVQYTLDTANPAVPTALGLATVSDSGVLGDNITSVRKPVLKGTAEAGSTVNVTLDSVLLGTTTADSRGNWTFDTSTTLMGDLSVGNHILSATAKDAAGNTGNAGTYTFSVPAVPTPTPAAPAITLASASDTGVVGDLRTQLTTPALSITGIDSAASQVEVQVDGGSWTAVSGYTPGSTTATYTAPTLTASATGISHTVAVRQTVNGVTSNASANTSLVVDNGNSAATFNSLGVQLEGPVTLTGTATAGETITLKEGEVILDAWVVPSTGNTGTWSKTLNGVSVGTHTYTYETTDAAGNTATTTQVVTVNARTDMPLITGLSSATDSGLQGDLVTNNTLPTLTGKGLNVGDTITLKVGSNTVGTTTVNSDKTWSANLTQALTAGANAVTVTETNGSAVQQGSVGSQSVRIDNTNTALSYGTRYVMIRRTNDSVFASLHISELQVMSGGVNVALNKTVTAANTVNTFAYNYSEAKLVDGVGASASNVFTSYDGVKNWVMVDLGQSYPIDSITLIGATGLTSEVNGVTVLLSNSPLAGTANIAGLKSAATSFVDITTTADSYTFTPTQLGLPRMLRSGETLTGSTEANATVTFYLDNETGTPLGSVKADAAGAWSFVLSADTKRSWSDGIHKLKMVSTDVAGNQVRSEYAFSFDQLPVLTIDAPSGTQGASAFLSGTGDAGSTITLRDNVGTVLATTTVNRDGQWRAQVTNLQTGSPVLTVSTTDASSNTTTLTQTLTVDATLLTRPQLSLGADTGQQGDGITNWLRPTLMGSGAAAGAVVQVVEDIAGALQVLGSATADANGYWSLNLASALSEGAHVLQVQQLGANGSVARTSETSTITIDRNLPEDRPVITGLSADTDTGTLNNDGITRSTVVTVKGTVPGGVPAGGKVYVSIDNATGQLATVLGDGSWTYTTNVLSAGAHTASATVADSAGNESFVSARYNFTVDTSASAPTATVLAGTGGTTQPVLSGTAEAGATVTVRNGGATVGTAVADDAGNWRLVINNSSTVLAANTYTLSLTQVDKAGNTSSAGSVAGVVVGATASTLNAYDQLGALTLSVGQDTGVSSTDGITQRNQLTVQGTGAVAGATVNVYSGTTLVGTTTATGAGTWSLTTNRLSDGLQSLTARQVKADGLTLGLASAATNVTVDTFVSPGLPSVAGLTTVDGVSYTGTAKPTLTGSNAEAGATVTLYDGEQQLAQTTVSSSGTWSITPLTPLSQGAHSLSVRMSDLAGNVSVNSPAIALTVDTQVGTLPAPSLLASSDSGRSNSDGITQVQTLRVGGTGGEAGATVTVFNGTTSVGSTTVAADGSWALTTSSLPAGSHQLYARQVDAAGNTSPLSNALAVQVVTNAPALAAPTWLAADDTGTPGDGVTSTGLARLTGSGAQSGATIDVYNGGVWVGQTTASEAGAWTFTPTQSWGTGVSSITVRQTDAAGNVSAASPVSSLSVVAAPGVLAAPEVALVDLSASAGFAGQIARSLTPTVKGTGAVAGARVEVFNGTSSLGTTTAQADGSWSLALPVQTQGAELQLSVAQSVRGIASATSAARAVKIDTAAVANTAITLDASSDSGVSSTDRITNDVRPTLKGQVQANSTVTIQDGDAVLGQALADSTGAWSFRPGQDLTGVHSFTAKVGNDVSQPLVVTIDKQAASAPSAPTLAAVSDTGTLANDAITNKNQLVLQGAGVEAGAQIEVRDAGLLVGKAYADGQGNWELSTTALGAGTHELVVRQIDAAGNSSEDSQALSVTVKAAPAAPVVTGLASSSDTGVQGDNTTRLGTFTLEGSGAEAGASVSVWRGNVLLGQGTATATGQWQVSTTQPLVDGSHSLTVRQTDVAGNLSPASSAYTLTVDSTVAAPTLGLQNTATNDTGVLGDGRTQNSKPVISGSAEAGATVQLRRDTGDGNTELLATVVADSTGAWSWQFGTDLTPGTYKLLAQQTDVVGNVSGVSKTFMMNIVPVATYSLRGVAGGVSIAGGYLADINNDGLIDIAVSGQNLIQTTSGEFVAQAGNNAAVGVVAGAVPVNVTSNLVDFNSDGVNEVASLGGAVIVAGQAIALNVSAANYFEIGSMAWADLLGSRELATLANGGPRLWVAPGKLVGVAGDNTGNAGSLLLDVNGDGYLDIIYGSGTMRINKGDGTGFTNASSPIGNVFYGSHFTTLDVNRDGVLDVFTGQNISRGLGDGKYQDVTSAVGYSGGSTDTSHVVVADLNGDGWDDLLVGQSGNSVQVWLNRSGVLEKVSAQSVFDRASVPIDWFDSFQLSARDVNGDRSIDMAVIGPNADTSLSFNQTVVAENTYLRVNVANGAGNVTLSYGSTVSLYDSSTGALVATELVGNNVLGSFLSKMGAPYAEFFGLDPAKTYDVVVRYPGNDQGVTVLTGKSGLGVAGIASGALREVVDSQLTAVSPAGKDVITVAREDRSTANDGGLWTGTRYADSMVGDRGDDTFTPNGANAGEAGDTVDLSNGGHDKVVFNTVLNLNTPTTIEAFTLGATTVADSDAINVSGLLTALGYSGARDAASVASVLRVRGQGTDLLLQANKGGTAGWQDLAVVKASGGVNLSTVTLDDLVAQGNLQLGQLKLSGSSGLTLSENAAQNSPTVLFANAALSADGGAYTQDMTHASLKVSLGDMYAEDRFSLASGSNGVTVSGSDVAFNGVVIGTIHSSLNGQGKALEVDFSFSGSTLSVADRAAAVQAVAQSVQYQNTGSTPPDYYRDLKLEVSDGQTKVTLADTLIVVPAADSELVNGVLMRTGTGGSNSLTGDSRDETFVGYGGPVANAGLSTATGDTLTGGGGRDTFVYRKGNVGQDTITDFGVRGVVTAANEDVINLSNLLQGYTEGTSNVADFVRLQANGSNAQLQVDYNGKADGSVFQPYMMVNLTGVTLSATGAPTFAELLTTLKANGQLVLG